MDINKMKVGLSYIFFENQKMDKMTKKQVLSYIEAADMEQLKLLAMDGDIHADLTKDAKKIINVRFNEDIELSTKIDKAALQGVVELVKLKEESDAEKRAYFAKEKRDDWFEIKRRCMKYRSVSPEKEKLCLAKQKIKHVKHWAKQSYK